MSKQKETKTNAMRILDRMKIPYKTYSYECDSFIDAQQTAALLGIPHEKMFKTLVTVSPRQWLFCICDSHRPRTGSEKGSS